MQEKLLQQIWQMVFHTIWVNHKNQQKNSGNFRDEHVR